MNPIDKARFFYSQNYRKIAGWVLEPGKKIILGDQENQLCRFCGKRAPDTSFRLSAHALPESLGNKSLFSAYECDECNALFGNGIENDFGNWSKPMRTFARIRGKNGILPFRHGDSKAAPCQFEDDPLVAVDLHTREIMLQLRRDAHTPLAVLKAFVKMGLSVLPDSEMPNFAQAVAWIRKRDHLDGFAFPVIHTFAPGLMPNDRISVLLIRRKDGSSAAAYMFFILAYGNEMFQVMLPSPGRDLAPNAISSAESLAPYPFPPPSARFDAPRFQFLDLSGQQLVHGETVSMPMDSDKKEKTFARPALFAGPAAQSAFTSDN